MVNYVINSQGEKEPFSFSKVLKSAKRAGASPQLAQKIAKEIEKKSYPGIPTLEIFREIKKLLRNEHPQSAIKFSLKEAMKKLGPTGFPFEKFIREIFLNNGFKVKINQYLLGRCGVSYEIDFLAQKGKIFYIGECKYHHLSGERVDLQVILANFARFLDIKNSSYFQKLRKKFQIKPILVTKSKFTKESIKYAHCQNTELLGWRYPKNKGLEYLIEEEKLYPITILPSFRGYLKNIFAEKKILLVKDILNFTPEGLSKKLNISKNHLIPLIKEAEILLTGK
jgi:hypothetical protein